MAGCRPLLPLLVAALTSGLGCQQQASPWRGLTSGQVATHRNLGVAYFEEGQFSEAAREFIQLLEIAPQSALAHGNLAVTYLELGEYGAAERTLKEGLRRAGPRRPTVGTMGW